MCGEFGLGGRERLDIFALNGFHRFSFLQEALVFLHVFRVPCIRLEIVSAIRDEEIDPAGKFVEFFARKFHTVMPGLEENEQVAGACAGGKRRKRCWHGLGADPVDNAPIKNTEIGANGLVVIGRRREGEVQVSLAPGAFSDFVEDQLAKKAEGGLVVG